METLPPTRRRWFRFSLRTLLVLVTLLCILCGYLGWAMNWIRQREAYRKSPGWMKWEVMGETTPAPWSLRPFGESGEPMFLHENSEEEKVIFTSRLFPEAKVMFGEIIRNGIRYKVDTTRFTSFQIFYDYPYFRNGELFQEEILIAAEVSK